MESILTLLRTDLCKEYILKFIVVVLIAGMLAPPCTTPLHVPE